MLRFLLGYDGLDSCSTHDHEESEHCKESTSPVAIHNSRSGSTTWRRGDDDLVDILYLGILTTQARTGTLSVLEQCPTQSQTRVDGDVLKRVLTTAAVRSNEYCVVLCGDVMVHVLGAEGGIMFAAVCNNKYPRNGAHFCLQEAKSKYSARKGQTFRALKKRPLYAELQELRSLYEEADTLRALVVPSESIPGREESCGLEPEGEQLLREAPPSGQADTNTFDLSGPAGAFSLDSSRGAHLFQHHLLMGKRRMNFNKIKMRLLLVACSLSLLAVLLYVFLR